MKSKVNIKNLRKWGINFADPGFASPQQGELYLTAVLGDCKVGAKIEPLLP